MWREASTPKFLQATGLIWLPAAVRLSPPSLAGCRWGLSQLLSFPTCPLAGPLSVFTPSLSQASEPSSFPSASSPRTLSTCKGPVPSDWAHLDNLPFATQHGTVMGTRSQHVPSFHRRRGEDRTEVRVTGRHSQKPASHSGRESWLGRL